MDTNFVLGVGPRAIGFVLEADPTLTGGVAQRLKLGECLRVDVGRGPSRRRIDLDLRP